jgi:peptidoglycan/LPS O-acetylase OafA/YrhL
LQAETVLPQSQTPAQSSLPSRHSTSLKSTNANPDQRVLGLDGLRGLAVLLVIAHHAILLSGSPTSVDFLSSAATFGWVGVDLFFVLSGFLITGILVDSRRDPHYFRRFFVRRALRIFPLYYAAITLFLLAAPALRIMSVDDEAVLRQNQLWYWLYGANFLAAFHPGISVDRTIGHLWSLAVEEQFYLVWPFVVALLDNRRLRTAAMVTVGGAFLLRAILVVLRVHHNWAYTMLPARADSLAMGALLAIVLRQPDGIALARVWLPRLALAAIVVIAGVFLSTHPHTFGFWDRRVQLIGYSGVDALAMAAVGGVIVAPERSWLRRMGETGLLRWFGRYSYALYVIHFPLMHAVKNGLLAAGVSPADLATVSGRLLYLLLTALLSSVAAWVSWYVLEQPFLRLKRFVP